ncbi:nucleotide-binding domain-containing protein [Corallococcus aberystwythensis]|uniref:Nucleotidyltransferase n=1 Tax=Corallococcus aberystwythensis TaxID=2316722 RepID=A0A3A8QXV8_9BACT|nr:nucleotidyltransferase [Corallococcus aberystwythensis]RKH71295.1 nucleotidyltransferase [Corallococcus aberystwythensis]
MGLGEIFGEFLSNLQIDNAETISMRYGEITAALNKAFRDTDSKIDNRLQVGSYGRSSAIKEISDLDMLYIMPSTAWDDYCGEGGQYKLLDAASNAIKARYPKTDIFVDRLVVRVLYQDFHVEVQPVFETDDGSFKYPDTYNGGSWKITKPREEIDAMSEVDERKNGNLRRLAKMARAWKNKHGVGIGGLLIDTLAHNFLESTKDYDEKSFLYFDWMSRDFFSYLAALPEQEYFAALGSGQRVRVKSKFQKKAKKAHELCLKAIDAEGRPTQNSKWRKIYGPPFPADTAGLKKSTLIDGAYSASNTEEFFESRFRYDVRYNIRLECEVSQNGFREYLLSDRIARGLRLRRKRSLRFFVAAHDIPEPFDLYWKVLNRGAEAIRRNNIRGQIVEDAGHLERTETANFYGDHIVECVAVKNGVVVATDRIRVPIDGESDG